MNCQEFARTIIEFGSDARALEHAENCVRCAALLNREQRLTSGLQMLAVEEAAINAPERLKSVLRAAFDEQQASVASPVLAWYARRRLRWGIAAAAMLLLSTITTALWLRDQSGKADNKRAAVISNQIPQRAPEKMPVALEEGRRASSIPSSTVARSSGRHGRRRRTPVKEGAGDAGELFPLTYVAKSGPAEFVQTVRVEISRSLLLSMGVPVNIDRGGGLIKADIIIGEDGVARAVRIIN